LFLCPWPGRDDNRGPSWPFFIMATASVVREKMIALLEPLVEQLGYELVDIEWVSAPRSATLRIFLDLPAGREGHIGIEDCERVSREVSALLDVEDPVAGAYNLEVSSPGFDRVLRKPAHFERFQGARVWVELNVARDGRRRYTGVLCGVSPEGITLEVDGQNVSIGFGEVGKARLVA